MSCRFCGCVAIQDEAICPECLVNMSYNKNADFDPFDENEMNEINGNLLLEVVQDDSDVVLNPDFVEEILNK